MPSAKVSIALCTFRGTKYLQDQLESLSKQTRRPDEVIIVDDASGDDTPNVALKTALFFGLPAQLHSNPRNIGVTRSFEKAIRLCTGQFIFLCDQDDVWETHKIAQHLAEYDRDRNCGYVFSDALLIDPSGTATQRNLWECVGFSNSRHQSYRQPDCQIESMLHGGDFVYGNTLSFRSEFRSIILPILSQSFTHDVWISLLLSATGAYGIAVEAPLVRYRQHDDQQAGAGASKTFQGQIRSAVRQRSSDYLKRSSDLTKLAERVRLGTDDFFRADQLLRCAAHLRSRGLIGRAKPLLALRYFARELFGGGYQEYSSSWASAAKDFSFIFVNALKRGKRNIAMK